MNPRPVQRSRGRLAWNSIGAAGLFLLGSAPSSASEAGEQVLGVARSRGASTVFYQVPRQGMGRQAPAERIKNYAPVETSLARRSEDLAVATEQGARCMDCGVAQCIRLNVDQERAHGSGGCPVHYEIPQINMLVQQGHWKAAYGLQARSNDLAEFTGNTCPAPCESGCNLGIIEKPVAIRAIEDAVFEHAVAQGLVDPQPPKERSGKSIGIIGSGPAGLAAAIRLNRAGHQVVVYERDQLPGGLLMYGIPNMKLAKWKVHRRIRWMEQEGIRFETGTHVGVDVSAEDIRERHDATLLAIGATVPRPFTVPHPDKGTIAIPGAELSGWSQAIEVLRLTQQELLNNTPAWESGAELALGNVRPEAIDFRGKRVALVGNGDGYDTTEDAAATVLRGGGDVVAVLTRRPRRYDERGAAGDGWPHLDLSHKVTYAYEELIAATGSDPRAYTHQPTALVGKGGRVAGIKTVQLDTDRNWLPGTEVTHRADAILTALGFVGPERTLVDQMLIDTIGDQRGYQVAAPYGSFETSSSGVFAAGDARRGPETVVWAINEGRGAAKAIDRYLRAAR